MLSATYWNLNIFKCVSCKYARMGLRCCFLGQLLRLSVYFATAVFSIGICNRAIGFLTSLVHYKYMVDDIRSWLQPQSGKNLVKR